MAALIMYYRSNESVHPALLNLEARSSYFDTSVRVYLAIHGYEDTRLLKPVAGQLWERLAEWGESR